MSFYQDHKRPADFCLTPPLTPQRSHKRGRDDMEQLSPDTKRIQFQQIHSQAHLSTVKMMMDASRKQSLGAHTQTPDAGDDLAGAEPSYTPQKPFWPAIARLRQT
ncbi:hypothetical protein METBIDRAFT_222154 [Metschnikowia bicuspidata var. bicuspidata NRRL YB-4993]|uniref:Uncharacterized protein n=1 Tax=Metschnikowia bicuspidata var. bicuspidata NRRL YB-4993 TaxID=869754 RepID=A0A1A0H630_9ASCO|nr:hypothetical protein METBIDRAFT_222154 [Metschnikowia bicuspidata var. bicuspidata NRRL YB-4993]OBA19373.1 hypothetical protein METBIDRAFT_222154 [Metschnikowia bicuspidata var. bicuspidata NRRL YB-4993]